MTRWLAFERRWCRELCDAIVPVGDRSGRRPADVWGACHRLLDAAPRRFRVATRLAVWVVMWSPLLVQRRPRTLLALDQDRRDAVLQQAVASRRALVRDLVGVLQVVACVCLVRAVDASPVPVAAPGVRL
ncbi:MAG TPA: hypothetical protein VIB48_04000 [Acidimicrobiia bacterium]